MDKLTSSVDGDNFVVQRGDDATQLRTLVRALRMQKGFGLYFVCVRNADQRGQVLVELREKCSGASVREVFLREREDHLLRYLQAKFPDLPPAVGATPKPVICVFGMENWLGGVEGVRESAFVADLNVTRNAFAAALGCPLVFVVPEHIWVGLSRGAPDFFSVRSGLYFLDTPPEERILPASDMLGSPLYAAAAGLGIAGRRQAKAEWEEMLNGYRALPPEQRDRLAEARAAENLAVLYWIDGDYDSALPLAEQVVTIREDVLGAVHPDIASGLNDLAVILSDKGSYTKALPLYERALAIRESVLGENHSDTAMSLSNIAVLYGELGDHARALPLHMQALTIWESLFGKNHPCTARGLSNLAGSYGEMGDFSKALTLHEQALVVAKSALSHDHPDTAIIVTNLGGLFMRVGDYAKALPLHKQALEIMESALGDKHPDTATSLDNLAGLYSQVGDYAKALPLFERALAIQESILGDDHPHTRTTQRNISLTKKKVEARHSISLSLPSPISDPTHSPTNASVPVAPPPKGWQGSVFDATGNAARSPLKSSPKKRR